METYARKIIESLIDTHALYTELEYQIAATIDYEKIAARLLEEVDITELIMDVVISLFDDRLPY